MVAAALSVRPVATNVPSAPSQIVRYGKMLRMKFVCLVSGVVCSATVLCASTAHAQNDRRFGFVIAYPTSVGVEWQAADRFTIRFDGSYRRSRLESNSTPTPFVPAFENVIRFPVYEIRSSTSSQGADVGVSVLIDVYRGDGLRLYLAPRAGVLISSTEVETTISGLTPPQLAALTVPANQETTSYSPSGGVAIGASHDVSPRFRIFGEAGVSYSRGDIDGGVLTDITQSSFSVRSGAGVVVLF